MKFLCDRCKTRYSIGDERVRGKILKIRCKNCANVITVREGMTVDLEAAPAVAEAPGRPKKATTLAPAAAADVAEPGKAAKEPARTARADHAADHADRPARGDRPGAAVAREPLRSAREPARVSKDSADSVAPGPSHGRRGGLSDDAGRAESGKAGAAKRTAADARRSEPSNALGAAFASAMAKPPPALEEEWYVSIDGDQAGPYSLAEAQRWVAQKSFDAELHCWSEGFDDWLPVDKVSHFRGLRKRPPAPAAPPPLPRLGSVGPRAVIAAPVEDEPKPLFAATMASLERAAPPVSSPAIALPAPVAPPARATPPFGAAITPRTNGAQATPAAPAAQPSFRVDSRPAIAKPTSTPAEPLRGRPVADPFDTVDPDDSHTQIEPTPFPGSGAAGRDAAARAPAAAGASAPASQPVVEAAASGFEGDDELAIGEVSRVVNLGDIVRAGQASDRQAVARRSGMNPSFRLSSVIPGMPGNPADGAPAAAPDGDPGASIASAAPVAKSHRRGLITLLSVAGVMMLGVGGAVILLVTTDDDPIGGKLGPVHDIDTSRPEDPITHRPIGPATTPAAPNPLVPRPHPRTPTTPTGSSRDPEPVANALSGDEVEDVARKHQDITQRCYMRSQRGVDSILVGDVKKIAVTLTIDSDGNVSDIQLSDHAADNLGKCLMVSMRAWKFRQSSGGTFRFSLNFVGG